MCLSLHLSLLLSMYLSRSLRSLLGLRVLLLDRYLDFPLFLSRVLERDLERDLCLRLLSLLRLRLLLFFFALRSKQNIFAVKSHIRDSRKHQLPTPTPQTHARNLPVVTAPLLALPVRTGHQSFKFFKCISCHFYIIFIQHSLREQKTGQ